VFVSVAVYKRETEDAPGESAAVGGAQLMARSRSDITRYDALINSYRAADLLPA